MINAILTCTGGQGAVRTSELSAYLTPSVNEIVRAETEAWIKRLRLVPYDGRSMRQRFTYRQDSLWWFTEIHLSKTRGLETAIATVLALQAAHDDLGPAAIALETDNLIVRDAAHTFGRTHLLPVETRGRRLERHRHARTSYLAGLTATLSRARPAAPVFLPAATTVAAFVQTSFAATTRLHKPASYVPQVLEAVAERVGPGQVRCVGVGSRRNLRRRSGHAVIGPSRLPITPIEQLTPHGQLGGAIDVWRRRTELAQLVTTGEAIRTAGRFRQYDLWAVLHRELESVALMQWPWAARAMDEATAALGAIKPELVVAYADAGGWGRAVMLETRRRNVPSVAIPCEMLPHPNFALYHEPDEMTADGPDRGFPAPDRILVFDQRMAAHLDDVAHIPSSRIVVTGHPRTDGQHATPPVRMNDEERREFRRELGVGSDQRLAVLIARAAELGELLPAIVAAAVARPKVHLAIKAHPGDAPEFGRTLAPAPANIGFVPESIELGRLLAGADGLITRESSVAVDALAVGVPSLVVGPPDHLAPLVDAGIMLGAAAPDAIGAGFDALLYDDHVRQRLKRVVGAHSARDERANARAADRAADAILEMRHHA